MDKVIQLLDEKAFQDPSHEHRFRAIIELLRKHADIDALVETNIDEIINSFRSLEHDGLWSVTGKDRDVLNRLIVFLNSQSYATIDSSLSQVTEDNVQLLNKISIVAPPTSSFLNGAPWNNLMLLPHELLEDINQVYFLHLLATSPQDVLPPGKSLLSVMTHPHAQDAYNSEEIPPLRTKVEEIVHKAFWDEAFESLTNPNPAKQLSRLKGLYTDIHTSVSAVIQSSHPVLEAFILPPSPTSSPLKSAVRHLREILLVMKTRCAPIRDSEIDTALTAIDEASIIGTTETLARVVVESVKFILKFADTMKSDMAQFVMGKLSESELSEAVTRYALESEKSIILEMWGKENIQNSWKTWLDQSHGELIEIDNQPKWVSRLLDCLVLNQAVSCNLSNIVYLSPASTAGSVTSAEINILPSPFLFVSPALLRIQNVLQALVAAALLRILVPSRVGNSTTRHSSDRSLNEADEESFTYRIWSLLTDVIESPAASNSTKLLNLADEVIRERHRNESRATTGSIEEDERIKESVGRLLNPTDPAFKLLQKRLIGGITGRISLSSTHLNTPFLMRTGLARAPSIISGRPNEIQEDTVDLLQIKGFEDRILIDEIRRVIRDFQNLIRWMRQMWADTIDDI